MISNNDKEIYNVAIHISEYKNELKNLQTKKKYNSNSIEYHRMENINMNIRIKKQR